MLCFSITVALIFLTIALVLRVNAGPHFGKHERRRSAILGKSAAGVRQVRGQRRSITALVFEMIRAGKGGIIAFAQQLVAGVRGVLIHAALRAVAGAKKSCRLCRLRIGAGLSQNAAIEIELLVERALLDVRQNQHGPTKHLAALGVIRLQGRIHDSRGGVHAERIGIVGHCQPQLPQVILALAAATRFTGRLDGRQQQRDEHPYDGNHHEQFDERERARGSRESHPPPPCRKVMRSTTCAKVTKRL